MVNKVLSYFLEFLSDFNFVRETLVWSFGMTVIEVLTEQRPMPMLTNDEFLIMISNSDRFGDQIMKQFETFEMPLGIRQIFLSCLRFGT